MTPVKNDTHKSKRFPKTCSKHDEIHQQRAIPVNSVPPELPRTFRFLILRRGGHLLINLGPKLGRSRVTRVLGTAGVGRGGFWWVRVPQYYHALGRRGPYPDMDIYVMMITWG